MTSPEAVALTLLRGISGHTLSPEEVRNAAEHFAQGPTPIRPSAFIHLFNTVINHLEDHPEIRQLAKSHHARLQGAHSQEKAFPDPTQAEQFIASYIRAIDPRLFLSTEVTAGYAKRGVQHAYATILGKSTSIHSWALIFTLEGRGLLDTGSRKYTLNKGDLVLFEPGAAPRYYPDKNPGHWGHFWLLFQLKPHWKPWLQWPKISAHTSLIATDEKASSLIEQALNEIISHSEQNSPVKNELINNLLERIILHGFELTSTENASSDPRVIKAQSYIEKHFNDAFTIEDVANHVNLSAAGLARLFKQQTGTTILHWRDEKRMMTAIKLLDHSQLTITEIAAEVGFSDPNFFSTKFKAVFECSPNQYRRKKNVNSN